MQAMHEIEISSIGIERFYAVLGPERYADLERSVAEAQELLDGTITKRIHNRVNARAS
jgi:hypothetical protein